MSNYVVTNIRLPEEDYLKLKEEAAKRRVSFSAVIREKVGKKRSTKEEYKKILLSLNTDWFTEKDYMEYQKARAKEKERSKKLNW